MSSKTVAHTLMVDSQGTTILSTLPDACNDCPAICGASEVVTSCGEAGKRRRGRLENADGSVFLCTNSKDMIASSRSFRRELEILISTRARHSQVRAEIAKAEALKTRRLLHNLVSLNAHALQDFYSVIDQERLTHAGVYRSQVDLVKRELLRNPDGAARLFLLALRNAAATKNEINVFRRLHDPSPTQKVSMGIHAIHRVVLNVANYFFQDFADQQVQLAFQESQTRIRLDYESMQVALYHLFDNAVKYAMPSSVIRIAFQWLPSEFEVAFEMQSLYLDHSERARALEDGFSGAQAQALGRAGQGLGMRLIVDLVALNNVKFSALWGEPISGQKDDGVRYARNRFSFLFPRSCVVGFPSSGSRAGSKRNETLQE